MGCKPKKKTVGEESFKLPPRGRLPSNQWPRVKTRDKSLPPVPEKRHDGAPPSAKHKRRRIRSTERLSTPTSRGSNLTNQMLQRNFNRLQSNQPLRFLHEHRSSLLMEERNPKSKAKKENQLSTRSGEALIETESGEPRWRASVSDEKVTTSRRRKPAKRGYVNHRFLETII
ncbi:hypothetical protein Bca52824_040195 [Brassica carinata]|uniref:Uncharacterized protein n=1 Tax=Brassica carinata TaxID=52824 RepID=A0A8X7UYV0_BRACI|nr:hypothetical protein Bca52824_040195 [Brassica carinata]